MENSEKKVKNIRDHIRRVLRDSGVEDKTLGYQIDLAASAILIFRKLRDAVMALEEMTITEQSREGAPRIKTHPLLFEYREQSKVVQDALDKLTMNIKSKKAKAEVESGLLPTLMAKLDKLDE